MKKYKWTSFFFRAFREAYGKEKVSECFEHFFDAKLSKQFFRLTGIDPNKTGEKIHLNPIGMSYVPGNIKAGVTITNLTIPTVIRWEYGGDKTIFPASEQQIDYEKSKIWFEELDTKKVMELFYRKPKLGFSTASFTTSIEVDFFFLESAYVSLYLNGREYEELIFLTINQFISSWNDKSEASGHKYGLIHNFNFVKRGHLYLQFYIDFGSAGTIALKSLFEELDSKGGIQKIVITSFP